MSIVQSNSTTTAEQSRITLERKRTNEEILSILFKSKQFEEYFISWHTIAMCSGCLRVYRKLGAMNPFDYNENAGQFGAQVLLDIGEMYKNMGCCVSTLLQKVSSGGLILYFIHIKSCPQRYDYTLNGSNSHIFRSEK